MELLRILKHFICLIKKQIYEAETIEIATWDPCLLVLRTRIPAEGVVRERGHVGRHGGQGGQRGEVVDREVALVGEVGGGGVVVVRGTQLAVQVVQLVEVVMTSLAAKVFIFSADLVLVFEFLFMIFTCDQTARSLCPSLPKRRGSRAWQSGGRA